MIYLVLRTCFLLALFCCTYDSFLPCINADLFLNFWDDLHLVPGPWWPWYTPIRAWVQTWYTLLPSESAGCPSLGFGIRLLLSHEIG